MDVAAKKIERLGKRAMTQLCWVCFSGERTLIAGTGLKSSGRLLFARDTNHH